MQAFALESNAWSGPAGRRKGGAEGAGVTPAMLGSTLPILALAAAGAPHVVDLFGSVRPPPSVPPALPQPPMPTL